MTRMILIFALFFIAGCSNAPSTEEAQSETSSEEVRSPRLLSTGKPITGLAVIPAIGHRGSAKIAVAHGNAGAAIYSVNGDILWKDETPAKLIGFYQSNLIVYRDHEDETRLDRYRIFANGAVEFATTAIPSPIAATTIQRTAYAPIGPVRLDANLIHLSEVSIEMKQAVSAFAAVNQLIPITRNTTLLIAMTNGDISIGEIGAYKE